MKRLHALPNGAGLVSHNPSFRAILINLVTPATRAHERAVMDEHTWPALPPHLRSMPDYRAMVRHWVATGYEWKPTAPRYVP